MANPSMRLRILILPIAVVVTIVLVIFYIKPQLIEMLEMKKVLTDSRNELEKLKQKEKNLQGLRTKWDSMTDEKTLVETALPEKEDADFYVSEIFSKASRSGVLITDIQRSEGGGNEASAGYVCAAGSASAAPTGGSSNYIPAQGQGLPADGTVPVAPPSCLRKVNLGISALGTWEQILEFFRYLEDMNRFSNVRDANISSSIQSEGVSDSLKARISVEGYFMDKKPVVAVLPEGGLADATDFNTRAIEKLRKVIFSLYSAPSAPKSGERNMFK